MQEAPMGGSKLTALTLIRIKCQKSVACLLETVHLLLSVPNAFVTEYFSIFCIFSSNHNETWLHISNDSDKLWRNFNKIGQQTKNSPLTFIVKKLQNLPIGPIVTRGQYGLKSVTWLDRHQVWLSIQRMCLKVSFFNKPYKFYNEYIKHI